VSVWDLMSERAKRKHEKANNGKVTINRRRTSKKQPTAKKQQATGSKKTTSKLQ